MYLIIGANGFLGSYILKNILKKTKDDIIAVTRNIQTVTIHPRIQWISCDISDTLGIDVLCKDLDSFHNLKVIFLASYHNPDRVDQNPVLAWDINVTSLSYFINKLHNVKYLFYASTDSVYGNSFDNYKFKEDDCLHPVNTYGSQKCAAESVVLWYGHHVVRYPFLIAPSCSPVKRHFYDKIVESLAKGKEIEMFMDSFRSSLSFDTGSAILIDLMESSCGKIPPILNICGDEALSKYDIGIRIAKKLGADSRLIVPISVEKSNGIFQTKRARTTLMDNTKVKEFLGLKEIKLVV